MRLTRIIAGVIIVSLVAGYSKQLFSWGLFNLFSDRTYNSETMKKVNSFDPDRDILFLPELGNKKLFESVHDLSITRRKEVRKYIYIYLTKGRKYTQNAIKKSQIYHNIVHEIFERNKDIPEDISLLPLLESGFNPYAVSRSRAVGLWQFVKNTSRPLGLKNDIWIDERRDVEKSTEAAIRHLRHLYRMFGSWETALAAYNGGAGHVYRSIKKTGETDYWALRKSDALNRETAEYVPKFIALLLIYRNQGMFGISDEIDIPEPQETEMVTLTYPVHIKDLSAITGVSISEIRTYNPELKRSVTPPYYRNYSIRLPSEAVPSLQKNPKRLYRCRFTRLKKHRVKKGECLTGIAQRYKKKPLTLSDLTT